MELRRKQFQNVPKTNETSVEQQVNLAQEIPALNSILESKPLIQVKDMEEQPKEGNVNGLAENSISESDITKDTVVVDGMEESITTTSSLLGSTVYGSISQTADPVDETQRELDSGVKGIHEITNNDTQERTCPLGNYETSDTKRPDKDNQPELHPDDLSAKHSEIKNDTSVTKVAEKVYTDLEFVKSKDIAINSEKEDIVKLKGLAKEGDAQLKADSGVGLLTDNQVKPEGEINAVAIAVNPHEKLDNSAMAKLDNVKQKEPTLNTTDVQTTTPPTKYLLPTEDRIPDNQKSLSKVGLHDRARSNASFDLPLQGTRESFESSHSQRNLKGGQGTDDKIGSEVVQDLVKRSESPARNMQSITEASSPVKSERNKSRPTSEEAIGLKRSGSQLRERRGNLEPMQVDLSPTSSEADSFSDDSLMEELQSAKVQEAKPISVSKSPINPFFPRRPSATSVQSAGKRSASATETNGRHKNPTSNSPASNTVGNGVRSFSASPKVKHEQTAVPKKVNVSSGISQRIKALTQLSGRSSPPPPVPSISRSPKAESSLVSQRMSSFRSNSSKPIVATPNTEPTPKAVKRSSKISFTSRPSSPPNTAPASTPAKRSLFSRDMNASKLFSREVNSSKIFSREADSSKIFSREANSSKISLSNLSIGKNKSESLSVTARIVRDSRPSNRGMQPPPLPTRLNSSHLELHKSQLTIEHQSDENRAVTVPAIPTIPIEASSPTKASSRPRSFQGAVPRSSSESSWRQFRRRQSDAKATPPPSSSKSISNSSFDDEERVEEKRASRTSRLFKRMSSTISGTSRKGMTVLSPVVREEEQEALESTARASHALLGDLNVQFPDTLVSFFDSCRWSCDFTLTLSLLAMEAKMGGDRCSW